MSNKDCQVISCTRQVFNPADSENGSIGLDLSQRLYLRRFEVVLGCVYLEDLYNAIPAADSHVGLTISDVLQFNVRDAVAAVMRNADLAFSSLVDFRLLLLHHLTILHLAILRLVSTANEARAWSWCLVGRRLIILILKHYNLYFKFD